MENENFGKFSRNFLDYFFPAPNVLPLEDNTRFLQYFFRFREGVWTFPLFPPPYATEFDLFLKILKNPALIVQGFGR